MSKRRVARASHVVESAQPAAAPTQIARPSDSVGAYAWTDVVSYV